MTISALVLLLLIEKVFCVDHEVVFTIITAETSIEFNLIQLTNLYKCLCNLVLLTCTYIEHKSANKTSHIPQVSYYYDNSETSQMKKCAIVSNVVHPIILNCTKTLQTTKDTKTMRYKTALQDMNNSCQGNDAIIDWPGNYRFDYNSSTIELSNHSIMALHDIAESPPDDENVSTSSDKGNGVISPNILIIIGVCLCICMFMGILFRKKRLCRKTGKDANNTSKLKGEDRFESSSDYDYIDGITTQSSSTYSILHEVLRKPNYPYNTSSSSADKMMHINSSTRVIDVSGYPPLPSRDVIILHSQERRGGSDISSLNSEPASEGFQGETNSCTPIVGASYDVECSGYFSRSIDDQNNSAYNTKESTDSSYHCHEDESSPVNFHGEALSTNGPELDTIHIQFSKDSASPSVRYNRSEDNVQMGDSISKEDSICSSDYHFARDMSEFYIMDSDSGPNYSVVNLNE